MTDILETILRQELEARTFDPERTDAYRQCFDKLDGYLRAVEKGFGPPFHEGLYGAVMELVNVQQSACFRHGFRLSGRLLAELLTDRL